MCKWGNDKNIKLAYPNEHSGRVEVGVDECLANLIQELNNHGIHTLNCCCGHGKGNGGILIHSDSYKILDNGLCEIITKEC